MVYSEVLLTRVQVGVKLCYGGCKDIMGSMELVGFDGLCRALRGDVAFYYDIFCSGLPFLALFMFLFVYTIK